MGCRTVTRQQKNYVIRAARVTARISTELSQLMAALALAVPIAGFIAGIGGWVLGSRILKPLQQMADRARNISAHHLDERLDVPNPHDELGALASAFNDAFTRLEQSFSQMRRFSADASHELRSPLTAIRTMGEVALHSVGAVDYREVLSSILEEADALRDLIDSLLTLSRADAGIFTLKLEPTDLAQLTRDVLQQLEVLAEEKRQTVEVSGLSHLQTLSDPQLFRCALNNVVDNAIQYCPEGSTLSVEVGTASDRAVVDVRDTGPGIAAEHREKVFERFYRIDVSRNRRHGGTGLGLAIARWAIEAQGGTLSLHPNFPSGSHFRIELPLRHATPPNPSTA